VKFPRHKAVDDYTGFLLRKVSSASFEAFSETVGAFGLHPMHFGMMSIIDADEPVSQLELSRRTGIDPSTMVARMDMLDQHGLVERIRSANDRRNYEIRLSPKGRELLAELQQKAAERGERFFAPLTPQERKQLHELLAKLAAGLDEAEAE
jgi:DNA-binding MarR family transcriptional regulator